MTATNLPQSYRQTTFQIIGFDRLNFVGDVTNSIPQSEQCRVTGLSFEVNGVRVDGRLTIQIQDDHLVAVINQQLRAVHGLVSVQQTNSSTHGS